MFLVISITWSDLRVLIQIHADGGPAGPTQHLSTGDQPRRGPSPIMDVSLSTPHHLLFLLQPSLFSSSSYLHINGMMQRRSGLGRFCQQLVAKVKLLRRNPVETSLATHHLLLCVSGWSYWGLQRLLMLEDSSERSNCTNEDQTMISHRVRRSSSPSSLRVSLTLSAWSTSSPSTLQSVSFPPVEAIGASLSNA